MALLVRIPNFAPWATKKDRHEEKYDVENGVDGNQALREPPQRIALDREEDAQDEQHDGDFGRG